MKKTVFFNCLLLVLSLSSCGDITQDSAEAIQANPTLTTFGATSLSQGQQVWFWADAQSSPVQEDYFKAWLLTSDADGHLGGSTKQHYPQGNQTPIDLYGLHGDFDPGQLQENDTPFPKQALTFKVETNQKDGTSGHDLSDLLYGIKKGVAPAKQAIDIDFVHMLSNVSIVLRADDNSNLSDEQIQNAVVRIKGVNTTATFTPKKDISEADLKDLDKRAAMLGTPGTPANIDLSTHFVKKGQSFDNATYGQAILIPQQLSGKWLEVTIDGISYYANRSVQFEPGRDYKLNVTVSDILDVQCEVTKWTDRGSGPVVNQTFQVGDYLYRGYDGKWAVSPGAPNPPDGSKGICIGVVFKVRRDLQDLVGTYTAKDGTTDMNVHGYAVALFDSNQGQTCQWSIVDAYTGTYETVDFAGYWNTQAIKTYAATHGQGLQTTYPACYWTDVEYERHYTAPDNSSGWFFPTGGQLYFLYKNQGSYINSITQAGGRLWQQHKYWGANEMEDSDWMDHAQAIGFDDGTNFYVVKSTYYYVRAVIAF